MVSPSWLLLLIALLVFGPGTARAQTPAEILSKMTLEQKVGQLFLVGFPQNSLDSKVKSLLRDVKPGGLILFRRNLGTVPEIRSFTAALREESRRITGVDPFLAVDQEGGPVARVPVFPPLPSAYSVGRAGREDLSFAFGEESGKILRWCGFNMNFAPVLDLSDPMRPSFIGSRSFGGNPEKTGKIGTSFAAGLRRSGILPTAKHFPGLGATVIDPHQKGSRQPASLEQLKQNDLRPFETYAQLGPTSALMVSQLSYPSLDPNDTPAPFSRRILKDLLRDELKYEGLIVTDDLQMKSSASVYSPGEAAFRSLQAGADIVMLSWSGEDQRKAVDRIVKAVRDREWNGDELDTRVLRILTAKRFLGEYKDEGVAIARGPSGQPATRRLETLDLALMDSSLQVPVPAALREQPGLTCVVSAQKRFSDSFRQAVKKSLRIIPVSSVTTPTTLKQNLNGCGRIVFAISGKKTANLMASLSPEHKKRTLSVNLGLPNLLDERTEVAAKIEVGYPHLHAGFRVAQWLAKPATAP